MGSAIDIVLADALATPVNHTFIPLGPMGTWDMVFEDQSQASPNGFWRLYIRVKRPAGKEVQSNARVDISLQEPVLEAIAPAASGLTQPPTVAYVPRFDATFAMSLRSSLQNRKDLRKMAANVLVNAQIIAAVENLVPLY